MFGFDSENGPRAEDDGDTGDDVEDGEMGDRGFGEWHMRDKAFSCG